MKLRHSHTPAGKSRAGTDEVYFSATKNLITEEVEIAFNEKGNDRRTSISMTPEEATKLAKRILEATEGRFSFDDFELDFRSGRV